MSFVLFQKKNVLPGPSPSDLRKKSLLTFVTPVLYDTPKWGRNFGDCIKQPQKVASPGDIVTAVFVSATEHPIAINIPWINN